MTAIALYHKQSKRVLAWMSHSDTLRIPRALADILPLDASKKPFFNQTFSSFANPLPILRFADTDLALASFTDDQAAPFKSSESSSLKVDDAAQPPTLVPLGTWPTPPALTVSNSWSNNTYFFNIALAFGNNSSLAGANFTIYFYLDDPGSQVTVIRGTLNWTSTTQATSNVTVPMPTLSSHLVVEVDGYVPVAFKVDAPVLTA